MCVCFVGHGPWNLLGNAKIYNPENICIHLSRGRRLSFCVCGINAWKCFSDSETLKPDVAASSRYLANVYLDFDFECGTLDVVPIETEYICERVQHVINQPTNQKPPLRSMRPNNVNGRIAFISLSLSLYYTTRILTNTKPGHSYVRMCVKVYMARRVWLCVQRWLWWCFLGIYRINHEVFGPVVGGFKWKPDLSWFVFSVLRRVLQLRTFNSKLLCPFIV